MRKMGWIRWTLAALVATSAMPAWALDPGTASGRYHYVGFESDPDDDEKPITVSHAIALRRDGPDQMPFDTMPIRVLLTDRDVPLSAMLRASRTEVEAMALRGEVQGVILEFDPADRSVVTLRPLQIRKDGGRPATTTSSNGNMPDGVWTRLIVSDTRVTGEVHSEGMGNVDLMFSAPVFTDPVTERADGAAAKAHPLIALAKAQAEALARGDLDAASRTMSARLAAEIRAYPPQVLDTMQPYAREQLSYIAKVKSVVIRGNWATAMLGEDGRQSFVQEDGVWKTD